MTLSGKTVLTLLCFLSQSLLVFTLAEPQEREVDVFPRSLVQITINTPSGSETLELTGSTTIEVDLASLADTDGNGQEQVQAEIVQLELTGTSTLLGPVTLRLRDPAKPPFQRSTGEIEEAANNMPEVLDIPPFTEIGVAVSFFDMFLVRLSLRVDPI